MGSFRHPRITLFLPILLLSLIEANNPGETSVERVGKVVTGAVETLSKKILNTTTTNTTEETVHISNISNISDFPASQGRAALDEARRAATQKSDFHHSQHCESTCVELYNALLTTVEGSDCRALFTTGKCPGSCMNEISTVTSNSSWPDCKKCDSSIVMGSGERWAKLCSSRQETLIDAGKEAVKTLVGESLGAGIRRRTLLQIFVGFMILILGVGYGYRRGRFITFRAGKRRLKGRKNSDTHLPI